MKVFALFLLGLFGVVSCSSNEYEVEDQLYACLKEKAENQGTKLKEEIDELEKLFIAEGYLASTSGKSKHDYFKSIAETGKVGLPDGGLESFERISDVYRRWSACIEDDQREAFEKSKFGRLQLSIRDSLFKRSTRDPIKKIAEIISSQIEPKDFEHPFYRIMSLVYLGNVLLNDETAHLGEHNWSLYDPMHADFFKHFALNIEVDETNEIRINTNIYSLNQVESQVYPYFSKMSIAEENHIRFTYMKNTDSTIISGIRTIIDASYKKYLNEKSLKFENTDFENLDHPSQFGYKIVYPLRLIVVRP